MASLSPAISLCIIALWIGWRLSQVLNYSQDFRRRKVILVEYPSWLGRFVSRVRYLYKCPSILMQSYHTERPLALPTPGPYFIHISSHSHIEELSQAPEDTLSLHAFAKDLLQTRYTMDGIEFDDNMSDNGAIHSRVLGVVLKSHLDNLQSKIHAAITDATAKSIGTSSHINRWTEVDSFAFATRIVAEANAVVFFGSDLASISAFIDAAMEYPKELFLMAEVLRFLPQVLRPYAAKVLKTKFRSLETLLAHLVPFVEKRFQEKYSTEGPRHRDLIQFFIESSQRKGMWSVQRIVQVILGVWFASVHQPALTLVSIFEDLYTQPEVSRLIREEILTVTDDNGVPTKVDESPLLDSFLKESARLSPTDSITARRKAIKPFEFSDGTRVEKNDVVCISLEALMRDNKHYAQSQSFDAYRHIKSSSMTCQNLFSDPSLNFPLWGLGRHVW
ncbi:hypothetical protein NX059_000826 [Plenodomus lindquistii]|nr:hypothetical protein NX059_000826 [Plenodomus lindquistii]